MNIYAVDNHGRVINGYCEEGKGRLRLIIPADSVPKDIEELYVTSDAFKYHVGDEGYFLGGCDFSNRAGAAGTFARCARAWHI